MNKNESKINEINDILNDEKALQLYIAKIENDKKIPYDKKIEVNILKRIQKIDKNKKHKFRKIELYRGIKVAGFTLFTLMLWNFGFVNYDIKKSIKNENETSSAIYLIYDNISNITTQINTFLITPINVEEGEII